MDMVGRVKGILLKPKQEWEVIAGEKTSTADLYKSYVVILAAIGPVAAVIGTSIVGVHLPMVGSWRVPITTAIASAVVQYVLTLVGVYVLAFVIDLVVLTMVTTIAALVGTFIGVYALKTTSASRTAQRMS